MIKNTIISKRQAKLVWPFVAHLLRKLCTGEIDGTKYHLIYPGKEISKTNDFSVRVVGKKTAASFQVLFLFQNTGSCLSAIGRIEAVLRQKELTHGRVYFKKKREDRKIHQFFVNVVAKKASQYIAGGIYDTNYMPFSDKIYTSLFFLPAQKKIGPPRKRQPELATKLVKKIDALLIKNNYPAVQKGHNGHAFIYRTYHFPIVYSIPKIRKLIAKNFANEPIEFYEYEQRLVIVFDREKFSHEMLFDLDATVSRIKLLKTEASNY